MRRTAYITMLFWLLFSLTTEGRIPGYSIIDINHFKISPVRKIGKDTCERYEKLLNRLMLQDQQIRMQGIDTIAEARRIHQFAHNLKITDTTNSFHPTPAYLQQIDSIDSVSFKEIKKFITQYGFIPVTLLNFPDSVQYEELQLKFRALYLHLSSKFGLEITLMIEESIERATCNEWDLMNFTILNVFRHTEFNTSRYFVIPLPDLNTDKYASYYLYAISAYIKYCLQFNSKLEFMIVPNYFQLPQSSFIELAESYNSLLKKVGNLYPVMNVPQLAIACSRNITQLTSYYKKIPANCFLICTYTRLVSDPPYTM